MKSVVLVALALVAVAAAQSSVQEPVEIEQSHFEQRPDGSYRASFKSSDGISKFEQGTIREVLDENNVLRRVIVVDGGWNYYNGNGELEEIKYKADESGYHPEGKSIPVNPTTSS